MDKNHNGKVSNIKQPVICSQKNNYLFLAEEQKLGGAKVKLTCIGVGIQNLAKKTL